MLPDFCPSLITEDNGGNYIFKFLMQVFVGCLLYLGPLFSAEGTLVNKTSVPVVAGTNAQTHF